MGRIHVIGPRGSGKTTYLAALAYCPEHRQMARKANNFDIHPLNEETEELAAKAVDIICEGASLPPTRHEGGIDTLPFYSFRIEPKRWLGKYEPINLAVRDYPGEIFDDLALNVPNHLHREFIDECLEKDVDGCLILLTGWEPRADQAYRRSLGRFIELVEAHNRSQDLRLAVAMSKCERGEIWPGRIDPEIDLFQVHLPQTWRLLRSKVPKKNLRLYALSTFGVLYRTDPRPNRVDEWGMNGRNSVLRATGVWQPYGLIAPLYWLSTGKGMKADA